MTPWAWDKLSKSSLERECARLNTMCEMYLRDIESLHAERLRVEDRPVKIGEEFEVYRATVAPWTLKEEIGERGKALDIRTELGEDSDGEIRPFYVVVSRKGMYALCDTRRIR